MNRLIGGLVAAAAAISVPALASAQPLNLNVNPLSNPWALPGQVLAVPGQIIAAPFNALGIGAQPDTGYNPAPARAAAVGYTQSLNAIVPAPVLRETGPRYENPAYRTAGVRPVLIERGAGVPAYVRTASLEDVSVPGLQPGARYDYFVSPEGKIVLLDPATRGVVSILR